MPLAGTQSSQSEALKDPIVDLFRLPTRCSAIPWIHRPLPASFSLESELRRKKDNFGDTLYRNPARSGKAMV